MKKIIYCSGIFLIFLLSIYGCNSQEYSLCGMGIKKPYYYTDLKYEGGLYAIKEVFKSDYQVVNAPDNNGIVRIIFDVNCKGKSGNFKVETYSLAYQQAKINEAITTQILSIVKELKAWIPGRNDEGEPVNSFKFFAIKIVNGEIQEILPK